MSSIFNLGAQALRVKKHSFGLVLLGALLVAGMAWSALARADELLDKRVHFDVAAAPLSTALIQFSAQSGVQVAVDDADVSHLQSKGLTGDHSIQEALGALLSDSGLSFSRVGASTVAIHAAPGASMAAVPAGAQAAVKLPDVTVIAPPPATREELAADGLFRFVVDHATTHYPPSSHAVSGGLLRWRGGRAETICPATAGLSRGYSEFISARIRAVAAFVGAPVQNEPTCKPNVQVLFTADPRHVMKFVLDWGARSLGVGFPHQMEKELDISAEHAIQGWYLTAGGGSSVLNRDPGLVGGLALQSLWPRVIPTSLDASGAGRSILSVIIVVDTSKVAGATIGSIADYIALVTLSLIETPDHCDPLPSVLDLTSTSCGTRPKPAGLTAGDIAFLKALYYRNTGLDRSPSRDDIVANMTEQLKVGVH